MSLETFFSVIHLFILEKGANVNAQNSCNATPLHEAVDRGDYEICQVLLLAGADPLICATKGYITKFLNSLFCSDCFNVFRIFWRPFLGKTAFDLTKDNHCLNSLLGKYIGDLNPIKDSRKNMHSPLGSLDISNYSSKSILIDTVPFHPLSAESIKSLNNSFEVPTSPIESRGSESESPTRRQNSLSSAGGIYDLLWPEPKSITELSHVSAPFVINKELHISIIQVTLKYLLHFDIYGC